MTQRVPMTVEGAECLRKELHQLKTIERPRISQEIAEARAHGDLKENAEYHAAREKQGLMEARIRDIEHALGAAHVIDITKIPKSDKVIFGATVELYNLETEESVTYRIVGHDEADYKAAKISVNSPIARAMIGKFIGDIAAVQTPKGIVEYEVVSVEYI